MGPPKLSRLSLLFSISTLICTTLAQEITTLETKTCGSVPGLLQCGTGFPFEFCCPSTATCMPLNSTGVIAAICCPKGEDCSYIQPITCDINQLNATLHPDNQVHLSDTKDIELPTCGNSGQCCPLGYKCASGMCSAIAAAPSPTSSASSTPSPTKAPSVSQTEAATAPPVVQSEQGFNGRSFAAGLFPGIVLGALGTLGLIWVIKKRRESQEKTRYSGDFGHVARTISDPIYDPQYSTRSDFIRSNSRSTRGQPSPNSTTGMVQRSKDQNSGGMTPKIKGIWERTPKLGFGGFGSNTNTNNANLGTALLATPKPLPPAIRAGHHSDPYTTPNQTPIRHSSRSRSRSKSTKKSHSKRPAAPRSTSTETIDVLMPAPSFLAPPKAPGMRENRFTQDSGHTTFTKLMERAGYEEGGREVAEVRNYKGGGSGSPARAL